MLQVAELFYQMQWAHHIWIISVQSSSGVSSCNNVFPLSTNISTKCPPCTCTKQPLTGIISLVRPLCFSNCTDTLGLVRAHGNTTALRVNATTGTGFVDGGPRNRFSLSAIKYPKLYQVLFNDCVTKRVLKDHSRNYNLYSIYTLHVASITPWAAFDLFRSCRPT